MKQTGTLWFFFDFSYCVKSFLSVLCLKSCCLGQYYMFLSGYQNNLGGNKWVLNSAFRRFLTSRRDHCFKVDAEYWVETLQDLA